MIKSRTTSQKFNKTITKRTSHIRPNDKLWRNIIIIVLVFFGILLLIGLLMGFHPPQPDSPVLYRISSARHTHSDYSPHQHHDFHDHMHHNTNEATIFVAMPSVNDPDCNASIISAFENAAKPYRIYFGVHQQTNLDEYNDCLDISSIYNNKLCPQHPLCNLLWHIRISRVTNQGAYGPTWGRYMADKHYKNETFYLITDSHTFFRKNWDDLMINMWKSTNNEYAIITHYPKGEDQMEKQLNIWNNKPSTGSAYHICGTFWESSVNHMPRNANGCYAKINDLSSPILVPFWAAGFAFSKSHYRNTVPFDPETKWLFHGEEFHHATRLWTFGYDFYSPQYDILFHKYADKAKRGHMPYTKEIGDLRDASEKRVNYLWGLLDIRTPGEDNLNKANLKDIKKYGLGNKRTLKQFWKFVGCDPIEQNITIFPTKLWSNGGLKRIIWNENDPLISVN